MESKKSRFALKRMAKRFGLIGAGRDLLKLLVNLNRHLLFSEQERQHSVFSYRWRSDVHSGVSSSEGTAKQRRGLWDLLWVVNFIPHLLCSSVCLLSSAAIGGKLKEGTLKENTALKPWNGPIISTVSKGKNKTLYRQTITDVSQSKGHTIT